MLPEGYSFVCINKEKWLQFSERDKVVLQKLYYEDEETGKEYKHKAVAVVGVSSGPWGGVRVVENLLPVFRELGLVVSQMALNIARAEETFSPQGVPVDSRYDERAKRMIEDLVWLATALRWGRSNL
jgi:NAD(P)H-dependent FMN reductase